MDSSDEVIGTISESLAPATDYRHEGAEMAYAAEPNRLLRALPFDDYAWLLPQLVPVRLRHKQILIEPDVPISHVWFVRDGAGSIVASEHEGGEVEVATVGFEGFIGLPLPLETDTISNVAIVQIEGDAWRIGRDTFERALGARPAFRRICFRYAAYFMSQVSQSVACNRLHTLEERCARWLLMTHDRVHGTTFEITQEFLATMLGVRRVGVSVAMGTLQSAGVVTYRRGRITVLDRAGLEERSCGCYRITQEAQARLLGTERES